MSNRVWDQFLTEQDRAHVALHPARRKGVGDRPALLLVDLYRGVFGDAPEPLLEAVGKWPSSCGLAGWQALPHIQRLLAVAREAGVPVIHVLAGDAITPWRGARGPIEAETAETAEARERHERRFDVMEEVAPIEGEMVLRKAGPSVFWGTPLAGHLVALKIDTLVVAGESTSGCVRASVIDGRSLRYDMVVVEDCVFDRHEATHAINLFDMDQKYADVVPFDEAADYLRRSGTATTATGTPIGGPST